MEARADRDHPETDAAASGSADRQFHRSADEGASIHRLRRMKGEVGGMQCRLSPSPYEALLWSTRGNYGQR